jgi:hypothetical protein
MVNHDNLTEKEAVACGLSKQELCQRKVKVKRELRKKGFIIPNTFIDLGLLEGMLSYAEITDYDYLIFNLPQYGNKTTFENN